MSGAERDINHVQGPVKIGVVREELVRIVITDSIVPVDKICQLRMPTMRKPPKKLCRPNMGFDIASVFKCHTSQYIYSSLCCLLHPKLRDLVSNYMGCNKRETYYIRLHTGTKLMEKARCYLEDQQQQEG